MLVTHGNPNCEIYDETKTNIPIIVEFYNNTSNMHIFTAINQSRYDCDTKWKLTDAQC